MGGISLPARCPLFAVPVLVKGALKLCWCELDYWGLLRWGRKRLDCFCPGALPDRESTQRDFSFNYMQWTKSAGTARVGVMRIIHICNPPGVTYAAGWQPRGCVVREAKHRCPAWGEGGCSGSHRESWAHPLSRGLWLLCLCATAVCGC